MGFDFQEVNRLESKFMHSSTIHAWAELTYNNLGLSLSNICMHPRNSENHLG